MAPINEYSHVGFTIGTRVVGRSDVEVWDVDVLKALGNFYLWSSIAEGFNLIRKYDVYGRIGFCISDVNYLKVIGNFDEWSSCQRVVDNMHTRGITVRRPQFTVEIFGKRCPGRLRLFGFGSTLWVRSEADM